MASLYAGVIEQGFLAGQHLVALRQNAIDLGGDIQLGPIQFKKGRPIEAQQGGILQRLHGGRSPVPAEERHFAEQLARPEDADLILAGEFLDDDGHAPGFNEVHLISRIPLGKDPLPGLIFLAAGPALYAPQLIRRQLGINGGGR